MASFTYYQEVSHAEHMLYAKEIGVKYGVSAQKAAKAIERYCCVNGLNVPRLYYNTKYGLSRVYPESIWRSAMDNRK
jgi:hypothetical protein